MTVGRLSHPLWRLLGQAPKSFCFQTDVSCWKRQMGSRCRGVVLQGKFADTSFGYFPAPNHSFPDINVCLGMWKKKKKVFPRGVCCINDSVLGRDLISPYSPTYMPKYTCDKIQEMFVRLLRGNGVFGTGPLAGTYVVTSLIEYQGYV